MLAFLQLLEEKYGGVSGYLKQYVHLSEEDIHIVQRNITVPHVPP